MSAEFSDSGLSAPRSKKFDMQAQQTTKTRKFASLRRGAYISLSLHSIVVGLAWLIPLVVADPAFDLAAIGLICCGVYIRIGAREARRSSLVLTPISWYFFVHAVYSGLCAIVIAILRGTDGYIWFGRYRILLHEVVAGYQIYLLGAFFLHLGLQIFRPSKIERKIEPLRDGHRQSVGNILLFAIGGLAVAWRMPGLSSLGLISGAFSLLTLATACSAVLNPPRRVTPGSGRYWILVLVLTTFVIVAHAAFGLKFFIMLAGLPLCWASLINRRSRWLFAAIACAMFASYLFVIEPTITELRSEGTSIDTPSAMVGRLEGHAVSWNFETTLLSRSGAVSETAGRMFAAAPMGYLVREVQTDGLQYGATMEYLKYAFVPRAVWPDKPDIAPGAWFTYHLGLSSSPENATTSTAMSAVGELYWNFGLPGVIAGMFGLGCLYAAVVWRLAGASPARTPLHMLAYLNAMLWASGEQEASTAVVYVIAYFLLTKLILTTARFFEKPPRETQAPTRLQSLPAGNRLTRHVSAGRSGAYGFD